MSGGTFVHNVISLVQDHDNKGAKWVYKGEPLAAVSMLEAAKALLLDDGVASPIWIGSVRRPHPGGAF
jgi:hypothetical protein